MHLYRSGWRTAHSRPIRHRRDVPPPANPAGEPIIRRYDIPPGPPWRGVEWSLVLIGLLGYVWSAVTYSLPIGQPAMAIAVIGLLTQRHSLRTPTFFLLYAAFLLWAMVTISLSSYPSAGSQALDRHWRILLITLVTVNSLRTDRQLRFFLFFYLAAFALYPIRGTLFNYFLGGYTLVGRAIWNYVYANPNDLAAICLPALGMIAALLVTEPRGWPRLAALSGLVVIPLVILLTQSRGAILALTLVSLLGLAAQRGRRLRSVVIVLVLASIAAAIAPESVWQRMSGLRYATDTSTMEEVDEEGSAAGRYAIWTVALALAERSPVAGVGFGAYPEAHRIQASTMRLPRSAYGARDTHSTYLNVLAETGIVGATLFLAIVGSVILSTEKIRRKLNSSAPILGRQLLLLQLGVIGFLLAGVFGSFVHIAQTYLYLATLWAAGRIALDRVSADR